MLSWIVSKAKGVTRHHLEGIGAVVIASIFIFNSKKRSLIRHYRSQSLGALHRRKLAVQRILDTQHARLDPSVLDGAEKDLKDLLAQESLHFSKLQSVWRSWHMSGKEETALKTPIAEQEIAEKNGRYQEAYELDMFIVEMFILEGDLEKAPSRKCIDQEHNVSDARRPLYKWLDEDSTHSDEVIHDFKDIQRIVQRLDKEIKAVRMQRKMEMIKATESLKIKPEDTRWELSGTSDSPGSLHTSVVRRDS